MIPHSVYLSPGTEQISVITIGLQVSEWQQHEEADQDHPFPNLLIRIRMTMSPLHEADEVSHIVGHLWS